MEAQISLKKQDNGQYDDTFSLHIETGKGKRQVKISESAFYELINFFPFIHTINPWPYMDNIAETAY